MSDSTPDELAPVVAAVHEALTQNPIKDGSVVVGWAVVFEVCDTDGERWLCKRSANAQGEPNTIWGEKGLLHEALFGDWSGDDD